MNDKQLENLRQMIQKETISLPGQTDMTKFHEFHQLLSQLFPSLWAKARVEVIHDSLLIKWPGKSSAHPILLMSHHDVVEENGLWPDHGPFSADIADGRLYGRGTLDTKGYLWVILQAADDLAASGFIPENDIYIESGNDEEISGNGAEAISKVLQERGIHFRLVLDEGGYITNGVADIGIGEKGCNEIQFIARSEGGHASRPPKNSALVRLGRFMAYVDDNTESLFPEKLEPMTNTTQATSCAFTVSNASKARNVLPREAYVITSVRTSHHQGVAKSIEALTNAAKQFDIETVVLDRGFESRITDINTEGYKEVEALIKECFGEIKISPYIMAGATDARYMDALSDAVIRFCPFNVDEDQLDTIHSANENVYLDSLDPALCFMTKLMQH